MKKIVELIKNIYSKYKELISYLFFGCLTTLINLIVYYVFAKVLSVNEIISSGLSWFFAVLFAYITNKLFVFESKTSNKKDLIKEILSFYECRIFSGLLCEIGIFSLLIKVLKMNDMISKFIVQFLVIVLNFVLSKFIIFKKGTKRDKVNAKD